MPARPLVPRAFFQIDGTGVHRHRIAVLFCAVAGYLGWFAGTVQTLLQACHKPVASV
jgi:hypothetical protein